MRALVLCTSLIAVPVEALNLPAQRSSGALVQHARSPVARMAASSSPDVSRYFSTLRPEATKDYIMQQTMLRVKDPVKSLEFYCDVLGFNLVMYRSFPEWEFNVYFVAQVDPALIQASDTGGDQFVARAR